MGTAYPSTYQYVVEFFDTIFDDGSTTYTTGPTLGTSGKLYENSFPPLNLWLEDDSKALVFEFAVAGIPKDKVKVYTEGDHLFVETEKVSKDTKGFRLVQQGIRQSSTRNKYYVPMSKYQLDKVSAKLEDGILTVRVPTQESQRQKQISID